MSGNNYMPATHTGPYQRSLIVTSSLTTPLTPTFPHPPKYKRSNFRADTTQKFWNTDLHFGIINDTPKTRQLIWHNHGSLDGISALLGRQFFRIFSSKVPVWHCRDAPYLPWIGNRYVTFNVFYSVGIFGLVTFFYMIFATSAQTFIWSTTLPEYVRTESFCVWKTFSHFHFCSLIF